MANIADKKIEILLKLIPQIQQWNREKLPFPLICRKLESIFKEKYQIDYPYLSIKSRLIRWIKKKTFSLEKNTDFNELNTEFNNNSIKEISTKQTKSTDEDIPINRFLLNQQQQQALREQEKNQQNPNGIKIITDNNGVSREVGTVNLYGSNQFVD